MKKYILLAFLLPVFFTGCKKYVEGPALSFKSKLERVSNHWKLSQLIVNGKDETANFTEFEALFLDSGTFELYLGALKIQEGSWEFSAKKESIIMSGKDILNQPFSYEWEIIRLKEKELWTKEDEGGNVKEYFLVPKV